MSVLESFFANMYQCKPLCAVEAQGDIDGTMG